MQQMHRENISAENETNLEILKRSILLSQGQFSLILACSNYGRVRQEISDKIQQKTGLNIQEIILPPHAKVLYTTIKNALGDATPDALIVSGLESVTALDELLISSNLVRNEFSQNLNFPMILWVTEQVLEKLIRLAPDFETYGSVLEFFMTPEEVIELIKQSTERVFCAVVDAGSEQFLRNSTILGIPWAAELEFARKDLEKRQVNLAADLAASLYFLLGRSCYIAQDFEKAKKQYLQSLKLWQEAVETTLAAESPSQQRQLLERQAIVLFHTGLCYRRLSEKHRSKSEEYLQEARNYFEQCLHVFHLAQRPDLVAKFIGQLGEILQHLQAWEDLEKLAKQALNFHENHQQLVHLAQDFGFLSAVALAKENWQEADKYAKEALRTLDAVPSSDNSNSAVQPQQKGLYLLLKAKALRKLGKCWQAIDSLKKARDSTNPQYDPQLYLEILDILHDIYFSQGDYQAAFDLKKESEAIEAQYGLRAFMGAGRLQPHRNVIDPALEPSVPATTIAREITATGRSEDLTRLVNRCMTQKDKLTIIYGQSGVGKSSLVGAGLVPALKQKNVGVREFLPVVMQVYTDPFCELIKQLHQELEAKFSNKKKSTPLSFSAKDCIDSIIEQLRQNTDLNLVTVLIFDQFEEFFFVWKEPEKRLPFFKFLKQCLNEPFVKVILSLREDYIYLLLEAVRSVDFDVINNDILSKDILFYLGNFSPKDTEKIIRSLTTRAQLELEDALISELVRDLAGNNGEVRPIELQVVGAQLQAENITTLAEYENKGPKEKLVERFLEQVIRECGPENQRAARLVLYFLTDENDTRPLKTPAELALDLTAYKEEDKLELVLDILVKSGLVFRIKEMPAELYQLVHDYLVSFIRQQEITPLEVEKLRRENQELRQKQELNEKLKDAQQKEQKMKAIMNRFYIVFLGLSLFSLFCLSILQWQTQSERQRAEIAEIKARNSESKALRISNDQLGALIASLKAGNKLQQTAARNNPDIRMQTEEKLQQAIAATHEHNRLEGHTSTVVDISFSPTGKTLATASDDRFLKLWTIQGRQLQTISASNPIKSVSFSPTGKQIAIAEGSQIKIWNYSEKNLEILTKNQPKVLPSHDGTITRVSWSKNGNLLASSSVDESVKLWQADGKLIRTLKGHKDWVLDVAVNADGSKIASASLDGTIKIWSSTGVLLTTIEVAENTGFTRVIFSPDGKYLAAAMTGVNDNFNAQHNNTIYLWQLDKTGQKPVLSKTFPQTDKIFGLSFSPDGEILVSSGQDGTVKLWNKDGQIITNLQGHKDRVWAVKFSPNGKTLASASEDKTVKLWTKDSLLKHSLLGHTNRVTDVSFSPDGKQLLSASADFTVRLWQPDGHLLKTLVGHKNWVSSVIWSNDGQLFASGGGDDEEKSIILWNNQGKKLHVLQGHKSQVTSLSWSPDDQILISASKDKTIKFWSRQGKLLKTLTAHKELIRSVAFSPDGNYIVSSSDDKTVKIWSREGKLLKVLKGHTLAVNKVSWSPDNKTIVSAGDDKTIKLWSWQKDEVVTLSGKGGHTERINSVIFSPDGNFIASGSDDKTIKIWRVKDGQQLQTLLGHENSVTSLSFSPDGASLASSSADNSIIVWRLELDLNRLLGLSCSWLDDYLQTNSNVKDDQHICDSVKLVN